MHDLECMKTHDLLQRKKGIKPAPDLVLEGVGLCMKINMLIKKRAGLGIARKRMWCYCWLGLRQAACSRAYREFLWWGMANNYRALERVSLRYRACCFWR